MAGETTVEAARLRIERLIAEIAALAKAEIPSEEFFQKYLDCVTSACDARGAALWLASGAGGGAGELQLCAQVRFETSLFQTDETQRSAILKILSDVLQSRRAVIFSPEAAGEAPPASGSKNRTPFPFVHVPLLTKDQPIGVLQVWLQPYVQPANYAEFVTFLGQLTGFVEQHLQSRRLGSLVHETQRLHHLLKYAGDVAGTLDPLEAARLTSNYGRDLAGSERCSVLVCDGGQWKVLSISGQEVVEQKSMMVKAMAHFVEAHAGETSQVLSKKELLDRTGSMAGAVVVEGELPALQHKNTDDVDLAYFEVSHVVSALIVPVLDREKKLVGALFFESTVEGYFDSAAGREELPASRRVAEWMGGHGGKALLAARDYQTLPLLKTGRAIRLFTRNLKSDKRRRFLTKVSLWTGAILVFCLYPWPWRVQGDCVLQPLQRQAVVAEIPSRLERVYVREGDTVKKGQEIAQLDTSRLQADLQSTLQEKMRYLAESDRLRAAPLFDEASAQVAALQAKASEQQEKRLRADIAAGTLRSPLDGVVLTKDLELRAGEFMQAGTPFAEVCSLDAWELQVDVDERDVGFLEKGFAEEKKLPVEYLLYSQSATKLSAELENRQQISAAVYAREKKNVFIVSIKHPPIPEELKSAMRPGLTGKAKIAMGHRPLIYVIGRKVVRWIQLKFI